MKQYHTFHRAALALMGCLMAFTLSAQTTFRPFPTGTDHYWRENIPQEMRRDYAKLAERYHGKAWTPIPAETFAEFRTTGNRTNYEAASFGVRKQLACLVMGEIMQGDGRLLEDIRQGLHYFMEQEPWWGIPAHYPLDHPESGTQVVDLFNAETASLLAWTTYMLGTRIDSAEAGLTHRVKTEVRTRFLLPTLRNEQGWKHKANNWNTWITSNWLACTLLCDDDAQRRQEALQGVRSCLTLFLDGYPDDGGCEEGVGYWDRAAASFFESLWMMEQLPENERLQLSDRQKAKMRAMGEFITTMHIGDLQFVNFSDASSHNLPNINILFPYGCWLDSAPMMQLAAYVGERYDYLRTPSRLFLASGNYPTLGRELLLLSLLPRYRQTASQQPRTESAYLENSQIMVASDSTWFVAAKGGHNGESHNHNDVGTYIVYHRNEPVVIDLGRDTYTALTFSERRYELMNNRSAYHNVPVVNGFEQVEGRDHGTAPSAVSPYTPAATYDTLWNMSCLQTSYAQAYPQEAGVKELVQLVTLDRPRSCVTVDVRLALDRQVGETSLTLMCLGEPKLLGKGIVALHGGDVQLTFDPKELSARWEHVVLPDGVMHDQWGDNVYRLHLVLNKKALRKGRAIYRLTDVK